MKAKQTALICITSVMATLLIVSLIDVDLHPIRCGITSLISSSWLVLFGSVNV